MSKIIIKKKVLHCSHFRLDCNISLWYSKQWCQYKVHTFTDLSVGATLVVSLKDEVNGGYQKPFRRN